MTKLFSSDYSVLSSNAHGNDKKVVYNLVRLAAIFNSKRNIFIKNLDESKEELEIQEKLLARYANDPTKAKNY